MSQSDEEFADIWEQADAAAAAAANAPAHSSEYSPDEDWKLVKAGYTPEEIARMHAGTGTVSLAAAHEDAKQRYLNDKKSLSGEWLGIAEKFQVQGVSRDMSPDDFFKAVKNTPGLPQAKLIDIAKLHYTFKKPLDWCKGLPKDVAARAAKEATARRAARRKT